MINDQYSAGFFDGEGCVTACIRGGANRRPSPTLLVCITNTNKYILELHKERWGGSLCERGGKHAEKVLSGKRQRQYQWVISAKMAAPFLRSIFPYVIVKKNVVEAAIRYITLQELPYRVRMDYSNIVERRGRKWASPVIKPEFRQQIESVHNEIKSFNKLSAPFNVLRGTIQRSWV